MTGLEYVLTVTFVAVWLIPLGLAMRWEQQLRRAEQAAEQEPVRTDLDGPRIATPAEVDGR
ncbi:MAG: hypothetical protein ACNA8R_13815 [Nitriliruptoraceae bacterium]